MDSEIQRDEETVIQTLPPRQARALLDHPHPEEHKCVLVDLRHWDRIAAQGRVPTSAPVHTLYIPLDAFAGSALLELPTDRSAWLLFLCGDGNWSVQAARTALDWGYKNVFPIEGGMSAYAQTADCPVEKIDASPFVKLVYDRYTGTCQYLVVDLESRKCAVVDPVLGFDVTSGRTVALYLHYMETLMVSQGLVLEWIIDTATHYHHVSGAPFLQRIFQNASTLVSARKPAMRARYGPLFFGSAFAKQQIGEENGVQTQNGKHADNELVGCTDSVWGCAVVADDGFTFKLGKLAASVLHTPGYTEDALTVRFGNAWFVGCTLGAPVEGGPVVDCCYAGSSWAPSRGPSVLWQSVNRKLFAAAQAGTERNIRIHVGHVCCRDNLPQAITTLHDQKSFNAFFRDGRQEDEFVSYVRKRQAELQKEHAENPFGPRLPVIMLSALQLNLWGRGDLAGSVTVPLNRFLCEEDTEIAE